jgi:hypothetical protein
MNDEHDEDTHSLTVDDGVDETRRSRIGVAPYGVSAGGAAWRQLH